MSEKGEELARAAAESAARASYGKLIAFIAARTNDVAAAEDAVSQAFTTALLDWPANGIPDRPEAWLIAVARRKLVDSARRQASDAKASEHLRLITDELEAAATGDPDIPDDRLRLMFACAHPAIESTIRAPLILQTILGFDAAEIASAFLVSPAAMSQRLVRAKTKIREARVPFRIPERAELHPRLDSVLEAIYATFAENWTDASGTEARRRNLADEAVWLGRLVASLLPEEPETLGLLALMLYSEARRPARRDTQGNYVPLANQNPAAWNGELIEEAEALLSRASRVVLSDATKRVTSDAAAVVGIGRYQLEAAIQSAHVVRWTTGQADWAAIARLYEALSSLTGSPVVEINRAIAVAETGGPAAGIAVLDAVANDTRLADYQPYWAARAELLARTGEIEASDQAYQRAIGLEPDPAVRRFLQQRRASLR
jgi:RNA polymerase sigma-70 factor (ECF subfamily)